MLPLPELNDGTVLHAAYGRPGQPPGYKGMAPASSSLWVLHDGHWYEAYENSRWRLAADVSGLDSWDDLLTLDIVSPVGIPRRAEREEV